MKLSLKVLITLVFISTQSVSLYANTDDPEEFYNPFNSIQSREEFIEQELSKYSMNEKLEMMKNGELDDLDKKYDEYRRSYVTAIMNVYSDEELAEIEEQQQMLDDIDNSKPEDAIDELENLKKMRDLIKEKYPEELKDRLATLEQMIKEREERLSHKKEEPDNALTDKPEQEDKPEATQADKPEENESEDDDASVESQLADLTIDSGSSFDDTFDNSQEDQNDSDSIDDSWYGIYDDSSPEDWQRTFDQWKDFYKYLNDDDKAKFLDFLKRLENREEIKHNIVRNFRQVIAPESIADNVQVVNVNEAFVNTEDIDSDNPEEPEQASADSGSDYYDDFSSEDWQTTFEQWKNLYKDLDDKRKEDFISYLKQIEERNKGKNTGIAEFRQSLTNKNKSSNDKIIEELVNQTPKPLDTKPSSTPAGGLSYKYRQSESEEGGNLIYPEGGYTRIVVNGNELKKWRDKLKRYEEKVLSGGKDYNTNPGIANYIRWRYILNHFNQAIENNKNYFFNFSWEEAVAESNSSPVVQHTLSTETASADTDINGDVSNKITNSIRDKTARKISNQVNNKTKTSVSYVTTTTTTTTTTTVTPGP